MNLRMSHRPFLCGTPVSCVGRFEYHGHGPKTDRLPRAPTGKLYTKFQFDRCETFWVITRKQVPLDIQTDRWIDGQTDGQRHNIICPILQWAYKKTWQIPGSAHGMHYSTDSIWTNHGQKSGKLFLLPSWPRQCSPSNLIQPAVKTV